MLYVTESIKPLDRLVADLEQAVVVLGTGWVGWPRRAPAATPSP